MLGNGARALFNRCTAEVSKISDASPVSDCEHGGPLLDVQRDDMLARRIGTFQKCAKVGLPTTTTTVTTTTENRQNIHDENLKTQKATMKENKTLLQDDNQLL